MSKFYLYTRHSSDNIAYNTSFIDHSQDIAKGLFTVRRLEKIYGKEITKAAYEESIKLETE